VCRAWFAVCTVVAFGSPTFATDRLIDSQQLTQAGLERMWIGQAEVGSSRDEVRFNVLHVNNSRAIAYFEIYDGEQMVRSIASLDRDALGNPLGDQRAEQRAQLLSEQLEKQIVATILDKQTPRAEFDLIVFGETPEAFEKRRQILAEAHRTIQVRKYVQPRMTLYTLNSKNVLQAFDAETGLVHWTRQIGDRAQPGVGIAANDAMVAVVIGTRVYCVEAQQGRVLWSHTCPGTPTAPPAMSHSHIFVPMLNGSLEAFPFETNGAGSRNYVSFGQINAQPIVTGRTVSWGTERGFYNVAYYHRVGSIRTRIKTNGPITAPAAKLGRVLFIPSMDGYVYAVDELLGSIYWEFATGSSISKQPLAVNDAVYFVTDNAKLTKVDARTGLLAEGWPQFVSGIERLCGASADYLYAIDSANQLVALRHDTGATAFTLPVATNVALLNSQTDRLFVIARDGTIQCLRQANQVHPHFHVPVSEEITGGTLKAQRLPATSPTDARAAEAENPFAAIDVATEDPFAAVEPVHENPFVTGTEKAGEVNPFEVDSSTQDDSQPADDNPDAAEPEPKPADESDPFGG
jgi:outer membrane protein assembly factor BamB